MNGLKLLFLVIFEEFKTLIILPHVIMGWKICISRKQKHTKRETNANTNSKPAHRVIIRFITAAVGIATLVNRFSVHDSFLYVAAITLCIWGMSESWHRPLLFRVALVPLYISMFYLVHAFIQSEHTSNLLSFAKVTLEPGPILDERKPFGTLLTLKNMGPEKIKNVRYFGWIREQSGINPYAIRPFVIPNPIDELPPEVPKDLNIAPHPGTPTRLADYTSIEMDLIYNVGSSQFDITNRFQFRIMVTEGRFIWIRDGAGHPIDEVLADIRKLAGPTNLFQIAPLVTIRALEVDKTKGLNEQKFPIHIAYVLENKGGVRATNTLLSWNFVDLKNRVSWDSEDEAPGINVWPEADVKDGVSVPATKDPFLYERLMTNDCFAAIRIRFNDDLGHKYETIFEAFHSSNNAFNIQSFGVWAEGHKMKELN